MNAFINRFPLLSRAVIVLLVLAAVIALDGSKSIAALVQMYPWTAIFLTWPEVMPAA